MDALRQDLRTAWRAATARPATSLLIVLVMALGIGANSAIFGLVDTVLFPSIPVREPDSLARVFSVSHRGADDYWPLSLPLFQDYAERTTAFRRLAIYREGVVCHVSMDGLSPRPMKIAVVDGSYFEILGLEPSSGRLLRLDDDRAGAGPVAVIGHELWTTRFGASPDLEGKVVKINGTAFTVVGVAPRGFSGLDPGYSSEVWVPFSRVVEAYPPARGQLSFRSSTFFSAVGRLRQGVTREQAQAELDAIALRLGAGRSVPSREESGATWEEPWPRVVPITVSNWRQPAALSRLLVIAVALVLLTACMNVAGLLLARAERNRRLTALHLALGAPRSRLLRILLLENAIYAVCGAAAGLLLALAAVRFLIPMAPRELPLPLSGPSVLSPRVLGATILASLLAVLLASLAPMRSVFREDPMLVLKGHVPSVGILKRRVPLRRLFVALQVAVSAVLLVGAGLFLKTLRHMNAIDPGVDMDRVVVGIIDPARGGYGGAEAAVLCRRIVDGARRLGTTRVAAVSEIMPPFTHSTSVRIEKEDRAIGLAMVSPRYFDALRIHLLRGREFEPGDRRAAPGVGIVNRAFADAFWPGQDPIGKRIQGVGPQELPVEIVGVAENTKTDDLLSPPRPALFVPIEQFRDGYSWESRAVLIVSTRGDPRTAALAIRSAIARVDPNLFVEVTPLRQTLTVLFAQARFLALLLSCFGVLVLVIAAAGLSALVSQDTASRVRELAIRTAVGARPADLRRLIQSGAFVLVAGGLAAGIPGALLFGKVISARLFGVSAADLPTMAVVAAALLAVAVWSAEGPLRRALRQGVSATLRSD